MAYRKTRKLNKLRKRKKRLYCKTKRKSLRGAGLFSTERIPFRLTGDRSKFNFNLEDESYMKMICLSPAIDMSVDDTFKKFPKNYITGIIYGDEKQIVETLKSKGYSFSGYDHPVPTLDSYQIPKSVKRYLNGNATNFIFIRHEDVPNMYEKILEQYKQSE